MTEDQDIPQLDDQIVRLPKDFRDDLAHSLLGKLYAFSKAVMGNKDLTQKMHGRSAHSSTATLPRSRPLASRGKHSSPRSARSTNP
jgi:hypothetical protein